MTGRDNEPYDTYLSSAKAFAAPVFIGDGIRLSRQKSMELVRLGEAEAKEAGQITNMRFRFAVWGREFTNGHTKRKVP